jgi:hypothetical protein
MTADAMLTYNTTGLPNVLNTASAVFPHAYSYDSFAGYGFGDWRQRLRDPESLTRISRIRPLNSALFAPTDRELIEGFLAPEHITDLTGLAAKADRPLEVITDRNLITEYKYGKHWGILLKSPLGH